jgi:hypothetical protein
MTRTALRRIACVGAILGLGVASSPPMQAAPTAPVAVSSTALAAQMPAGQQNSSHVMTTIARPNATGQGWGAMIACAGCIIAAGVVVGSGPGAIAVALNAPGSAIALLACAAACYEAFQ